MNKELMGGLAWGAALLALSFGAVSARKMGLIEADTVTRLVLGSNGLMIAWFGNRLPKAFVASDQARRARRFAGWSQVLSGLVYTGAWAFAPISVAAWLGTAAVLSGLGATLAFCLSLPSKRRTS